MDNSEVISKLEEQKIREFEKENLRKNLIDIFKNLGYEGEQFYDKLSLDFKFGYLRGLVDMYTNAYYMTFKVYN